MNEITPNEVQLMIRLKDVYVPNFHAQWVEFTVADPMTL